MILALLSFITFVLGFLSLAGYRIGIVWRNDDDVRRYSIPVSWGFAVALALTLWYSLS